MPFWKSTAFNTFKILQLCSYNILNLVTMNKTNNKNFQPGWKHCVLIEINIKYDDV